MRRILLTALGLLIFNFVCSAQITWEKKNGPYGGYISDIEVAPVTGTLLSIASNSQSVYRSTDNGVNWQLLNFTIDEFENVNDVAISPNGNMFAVSSQSRFYKSIDDGVTWAQVNTGTSSLDGGFDSGFMIAINSNGTPASIILQGHSSTGTTFYISEDNGVTWQLGFTTNNPGVNDVFDGMITDGNGDIFIWRCCGTARIYRSNDGGYNFAEITTGLGDLSITSAAVTPDGSNVYCANRNSVFHWNGTSWDDIGISESLATVGDNSVMASGTDGIKSYLFYGDGSNGKLYRKDLTGSNNWVEQHPNFAVAGAFANVLRAKTHNQIYVGTQEIGLFRSTNGGSSWISSNNGIEAHRFNDMVITNDESRIIVATDQSIYSSVNEGGTWARYDITIPNNYSTIRNFVTLDNGEIYGYGSVGKKSVDNGASWTDIPIPVTDIQIVVNTDQTRFFAIDFSKNFYFTDDKGANWTSSISVSGLPTMLNYEELTPGPNHTLFASIRDYDLPSQPVDLYQITFSPDPGTMTPTSGAAVKITTSTPGYTITQDLSGVQYVNGVLYAYGRNASSDWVVCISNDGGASFTNTLVSESGYGFVVDRNGYIHMLSYDGNDQQRVFISRDNGVSFVQTDVATVSNGFIQQLKVGPVSGIAYITMEYNGVYKTTGTIVVPDPPINLVEVGRGKNGVSFRFEDAADIESGFVIQREEMGIFISIDTTGTNSGTGERRYFRDRNLTPGTTYNYRVAAYNSAGASAWVPISITTLAETTPSIPDNRSWTGMTQNIDGLASPGTNTTIAIKHLGNGRYSISDVSGGVLAGITGDTEVPGFFYESSGQTYFEPNEDFDVLEEQNGTWDTVDDITLFWRLDKDANGGPYPDKYEQIDLALNPSDPIPAAPTNVLNYVYSNTSIEVSWIGTAFEEEFLIDRSTAPGGPFSNVGSIAYPATSYIDADAALAFGQTYYYQVRGSNSTGASPPSATSAGVTFNAPNFVLTNSEVTNNSQGLGTGFIWGDYDNDGDEDLILVQLTFFVSAETTPYAFRNNGDGTFTSVNAGFDISGYITGAASDYDNDGNLDIFITSSTTENLLYRGNGDFTFTKVDPNQVGENIPDFENASLTASWIDYDNNGLLDLFVTNQDSEDILFTQTAADVFTKVVTGEIATFSSRTNTAAWADYDNDGDMDVFVLNNSDNPPSPNRLYQNNGDGTFTHLTGLAFDADLDAGAFGASWGDYDNDGDMDLFLCVQEGVANLLYRNNGAGGSYSFTKVSGTPVTDPVVNPFFGSAWGDIDNDGDLDLLLGGVLGESVIYKGDGAGNFGAITNEKFNDASIANFGISLGDYDNDGFLDLAASAIDPLLFMEEEYAGPGVNSYLFKSNQTSSASTNWLKVKLTGTISNKSAIGARLTLTAGGKTQIREITTSSGFGGQNSLIAHFGLGSETTITSLQIKWPSGVIQTIASPAINQLLQVAEDGTGPQVTTLLPTNSSTNVAVDTNLEITFDEPPIAVGGKNIVVSTGATPVFTIAVTTGAITGNKVSFTLPSSLQFLTVYDVAVDAGAFTDGFSNPSLVINWSFTTIDNVPPVIVFTPPATLDKGFGTTTFEVDITDNGGTVSTAKLSYRKIGGGPFTELDGTLNGTTGLFDFAIQESFFDAMGLEYFIKATDPSSNEIRLPVDPTNFNTSLNYKLADSKIPASVLGFGGQITNWKVFAIPFELGGNNSVTSVFDELNDLTYKIDWRMLTYVNETAWGEYPGDFAQFARGKGYFINIKSAIDLFVGEASAPTNTRSNLFQLSLKQGWNQIGNPYLTSISWSDASALNGLTGTAAQLKKFATGSYVNATDLQPFEGGFVFVDSDVTVSIPFAGQTAVGGRQKQFSSDLGSEKWQVPLALEQGDIQNNLSGVGMSPAASASIDNFDDINPPRFVNYLEMNFDHPEHFAKRFSKDIVPTQEKFTWEFSIASNLEGMVTLHWDNSSFGSNQKDLILVDVTQQLPIDMRINSSYTFDATLSDQFKVHFGEDIKTTIQPERIVLGKAYPNPVTNMATIAFTLPPASGTYHVRLEVYDMMGRKVDVLQNGMLPSGFYESNWDVSNNKFRNGLYTYRLMVAGDSRNEVYSEKLILNK